MMRGFENIAGIGSVSGADDTGEVQKLQVTEKAAGSGFMARVLDKVSRLFAFGFTSVPPLGSEVLMLRLGGDRNCSIAISTDHRASRPKGLQPGDSAMYDVRGIIIKMTSDGLEISAAGLPIVIHNASKLTLDVPEVECTGTLKAAGEITALTGANEVALGALRDTYNGHDHGGIVRGSARSDKPVPLA
ncbi:phage baseplate assembly protein domain-containing protein [Novosphingobium humi]|uniref:Phage baseplate assembly protein n=1 Tax=Novosphingobium humi TaxID=2282397 RepID=A0ABY7U0L5_9SPHN|nr:phage baseplate assembly protein [Novosphingobium humi]WCT78675.1 phage baseplate assembly protein [Novosphingobium humi]